MRKISWGCNSPVCLWTQPESFAPPKIETPNSRVYQKLQEQFTFTWAVLGGVKFPTGDSHRLGDPDFAEGIGGHDLASGGRLGRGLFAVGDYCLVILPANASRARCKNSRVSMLASTAMI